MGLDKGFTVAVGDEIVGGRQSGVDDALRVVAAIGAGKSSRAAPGQPRSLVAQKADYQIGPELKR